MVARPTSRSPACYGRGLTVHSVQSIVLPFSPSTPLLSAEVPGTGGVVRASADDFAVEEIAAYQPCGEGDHVYAWIEKRELTTMDAVQRLARALDVRPADIGTAGLKDKRAVTRQWVSLPPPLTPEAVGQVNIDGLRVLETRRHTNKLKTGHLFGNRFRLVVRDLAVPVDEALARAEATLAILSRPPGSPNWYGEQRFGRDGDNAEQGKALILGRGGARGGPRQKRLLISAFQSALFNRYLHERITGGLYRQVIDGDILCKPTGASFTTSEPAVDQVRLEAGEIAITGPMFGHRMRQGPPESAAHQREQAILAEHDIALADFRRVGKLGFGTRRPLSVTLGDPRAQASDHGALVVEFTLPAGAYATCVLREICKSEART